MRMNPNPSLEQPYDRPFRDLNRNVKIFDLEIKVSIDKLKLALMPSCNMQNNNSLKFCLRYSS